MYEDQREKRMMKSENSIEKVFHELETHSPEYFRLAATSNKNITKSNTITTTYQNAGKGNSNGRTNSTTTKCEVIVPKTHSVSSPGLSLCVFM